MADTVRANSWMLAIDVGGTFTDAIAIGPEGQRLVTKVPSTPSDPAVALRGAVVELQDQGASLSDVSALFHGTTVATNAAITGDLANCVLVTTTGYADVLAYRTGARPRLYDLEQPRPMELIAAERRVTVEERLAWDGAPVIELSNAEIARVVAAVADLDPEAVAICLLFSYMNGAHERRLRDELARHLPDVPITISSEVAREFREYPRTATTALNAGLRPVVGSYLLRARDEVRQLGMDGSFLIMQSNGGSVPAERADEEAHRLLLSGPTAGVAGTIALGARSGLDNLISFDMGGTSLDLCLIRDGVPPIVATTQLEGHPILAPSVDMVTIGAGGGSIATVDNVGRLRVGPKSAGADPGPAAYGRGGKQATLTDAHVVVGTLGGSAPLAGRLSLDHQASLAVVGELADELRMDVVRTGEGIIAVAMAHVVRAMRSVSVERGIDPGDCTVVAFGGAGPLHAPRLLDELGIGTVIVPPNPGLFSASGLVAADLRIDESQTVLQVVCEDSIGALRDWYQDASGRVEGQLVADGIPAGQIRLLASADCRYLGQGFELSVPLAGHDRTALEQLVQDFHKLHARTYGHVVTDELVELVTLRVSGFGGLARPQPARADVDDPSSTEVAVVGRRGVLLPVVGKTTVKVYNRALLVPGHVVRGPAIIEEMDSTTLVLPQQDARVDEFGSLWLTRGEAHERDHA
jgi:N-methylhydantoinase A